MGATRDILTSSDDPLLPIALPLGDWLVADACVDNVVSLASEDLDYRSMSIGTRIRETGWSVTASILDAEQDSGRWPPSHDVQRQVVTIPLTAEQWAFVVSAVRRAHDAQTSLGQHGEAAHSAVLQDLITAAVAACH